MYSECLIYSVEIVALMMTIVMMTIMMMNIVRTTRTIMMNYIKIIYCKYYCLK